MEFPSPGQHKSFVAFETHLQACARELREEIELDKTLAGQTGPFGWPLTLQGHELDNRFAMHPMEGWDGTTTGRPSELTLRRWRAFGRSGAAMIWGGEAFAVTPEGRANPRQLALLNEAHTAQDLSLLIEAIHKGRVDSGLDPEGAFIGLQMTHSGRHAQPTKEPRPILAAHATWLDEYTDVPLSTTLIRDDELEALIQSYVRLATLAQAAGFDFVDIKACHGYLVHELLGARSRPGPFGGDYAGRTRFLMETIAAIQRACPDLGIGVRLCAGDVFPHKNNADGSPGQPLDPTPYLPLKHGWGMDLENPTKPDSSEAEQLVRDLYACGVKLINVTLGSPYSCPHLQRPSSYPPVDGYPPPEDPLLSVLRQVQITRRIKAACPHAVVVGTGYTYLQEWFPYLAQAELRRGSIDLVGLGRMVLSYPEFPLDLLAGRDIQRTRICRTFSDCTNGPRLDLVSGCYPLDREYRQSENGQRLRELKAQQAASQPRKS
ncbi:MAG TPA: NADH:flavin oxidoreductase [Planctomycetes bacterium]|nr:NADH:flavin oxidoreductase [Planctomycetota bacterium]HIL36006.1 NADH:flavin oxidoreductase [Planctomycetota bacterium]